ncbi:MAG TPA: PspC domain-containing protein [Pseudonocardiaceae bacterium]|nr:PspC domain-containing protein [Pseudonocardiaceae bacterium]
MSTQRGLADIEDTAREFWASRPMRPRRGRMIAGVAAGIGRRYGIDPVIVRVVLVISAFYGGAGLLAYLLGWLFLPNEGDQGSAFESMVGRGRSSVGAGFTVLLCLALIPAAGFVLGGRITQLIGAVMLVAALYLLHRSRAGHVPPAPSQPSQPVADAADTEVGSMSPGGSGEETVAGQQQTEPNRPPSWDPLGAAPFAWDLPDPNPAQPPAPPEPPAPRRRSRVALVTIGFVLVALGAMALVEPHVHGWLSPAHVVGIVTGIIGIGLVAGSVAHGGRWLILPALVLSVASVGLTTTGFTEWRGGGEVHYQPTTLAQALPEYDHTVGDMTVDLTGLPNSGSVTTTAHLTAGDLTIRVPEDADVVATCHSNAGDVDCLGQEASGPNSSQSARDDGPDGPGGLTINLTAEVGTGDLEVIRG